jgi:hypothetical protein
MTATFTFYKPNIFAALNIVNKTLHMFQRHFTTQNFRTLFFSHCTTAHRGPVPPPCRSFTITLTHAIVGRTPLNEWSAWHRDLWQHTILTRQTSMPPTKIQPTISASEWLQPHTLDCTAIYLVVLMSCYSISLGCCHISVTQTKIMKLQKWMKCYV